MGTGVDTAMGMGTQALALLPEIVLLLGALAVLLSGSFLPRRHLGWTRALTLVALAGSGLIAAVQLDGPARTVFDASYAVDTPTGAARLIVLGATALIVLLAGDELAASVRQAETCCLLLLGALGATVLAGAHDLLLVVTGFLLASVPLYALVGLPRTRQAAEAAMKTYFFGSLFGIVLMAGVAVLYGVGGSTSYTDLAASLPAAPRGALIFGGVAVLGGLMFKAGGVPGHFWVPDATQAGSTVAAAYLTTIPKIGALVAAYRLVLVLPGAAHAPLLVALLAAASMTLGNLAAFAQDDPRRLLGWSTVSQVGYLLVPVAVAGRSDLALPGLLVYLAGYAVTNIAAFAVVAALPERRDLDDYAGLFRARPGLAAALTVSLLGLVGTPPTAVFVGKLAVATAAWDGGRPWLTITLLVNSVVSLFYYLRWIAPLVRATPGPGSVSLWGYRSAVVLSGISVAVGLLSALLWGLFGGPAVG